MPKKLRMIIAILATLLAILALTNLDDEHEGHWLSTNGIKNRRPVETTWCPIGDEDYFVSTVSEYANKGWNTYVGLGGRTNGRTNFLQKRVG